MRKMLSISRLTMNSVECFEEWLADHKAGTSLWSTSVDDAMTFDADSEGEEFKAIFNAIEETTPVGIEVSANVFFRMETRFH